MFGNSTPTFCTRAGQRRQCASASPHALLCASLSSESFAPSLTQPVTKLPCISLAFPIIMHQHYNFYPHAHGYPSICISVGGRTQTWDARLTFQLTISVNANAKRVKRRVSTLAQGALLALIRKHRNVMTCSAASFSSGWALLPCWR